MTELVLASDNAGKIAEIRAIVAEFGLIVRPQGEFGIRSAEETGTTFLANALLKARHAARLSGQAALADDSGLEVDALGGAPGVYSARYAGPAATDAANNAKLLEALAGFAGPRTARYRCVIAVVGTADDPAPLVAEGTWEGAIAYAPLFLVAGDPAGRTAAEWAAAEKNTVSHRGQALAALRARLANHVAVPPGAVGDHA
jgi:XTP/dITP diphosphohydrolase